MKKFMMMVLALSFVGTTAMAFEGALQMNAAGDVAFKASTSICKPVEPGTRLDGDICTPADGKTCYAPFRPQHKYYWAGWSKGFKRGGVVCVAPRQPMENN